VQTHGRPYSSVEDLSCIAALTRRAYAQAPECNAWSVARFDIWARHRLADAESFGRCAWQGDIHLWHDAAGTLLGAALVDGSREAALILDPERRDLAGSLLDWVEARVAAKGLAEPIAIEVLQGHTGLVRLFEARGYTRSSDYMVHRKKPLAGTSAEPVLLPPGYTIRPRRTPQDLQQRLVADKAVFNYEGTVEDYRSLQQAPSYLPELDLIVFSPAGEAASYCSVWLDQANSVAEFEPVGTLPEHRRRGLARAMMAEACNRLRAMGVPTAAVDSWSESPAANALYAGAGFEPWDRAYGWERR